MLKLPVLNKDGKEVESLELPEKLFGNRLNTYVMNQAVVMYRNALRQGTASTKERGSVSGGGKKPWRQKGTGRARQGSIRSPLWIGGGVVFGPHPRNFSYTISKKVKTGSLRESLHAKYISKDLCCIQEFKDKFSKTKEFAEVLKALKIEGTTLAILDGCDDSVQRVSRNIPHLDMIRSDDINAYDILRYKKLLLTKTAFKKILKRIQK